MMADVNRNLYVEGKCYFFAKGPTAFAEIAEEAFQRTMNIEISLDKEKFMEVMRGRGVPEEQIQQYLESFHVLDETYLVHRDLGTF